MLITTGKGGFGPVLCMEAGKNGGIPCASPTTGVPNRVIMLRSLGVFSS